MPRDHGSSKRRMSAGAVATAAALVSIENVVRRLGYVGLKVYELLIERYSEEDDYELLIRLNDELKPLIDGLLHFTLEGDNVSRETLGVDNGNEAFYSAQVFSQGTAGQEAGTSVADDVVREQRSPERGSSG